MADQPRPCGKADLPEAWVRHLDALQKRLRAGLEITPGRITGRDMAGFAAEADVEREIAERRSRPATEPQ